MDSQPSIYSPLGERDFRVLLLSGEVDGLVQCELKALNLDRVLSYVALSYTWGDSDDMANVLLNGEIRQVRTNLAQALARLLHLGHHIVWADALSIDQSNIAERNSQVAVMRNIFEKAHEVIVWLEGISDRAGPPEAFRNHFCGSYQSSETGSLLDIANDFNNDTESRAFLYEVLTCDYWHRAWITQEIVVASRVKVIFNQYKVDWSCLDRLTEFIFWIPDQLSYADYDKLWDVTHLQKESNFGARRLLVLTHLRRQRGQSLLTILNLTTGTNQRDPRDAIYSKLGLASDSNQILAADYSKDPAEIYIALVIHHIEIKKRLDIICSAEPFCPIPAHLGNLHLPSWVPDWRLEGEAQTLCDMIPTNSTALLYNAGAGASMEFRVDQSSERSVLVVLGFIHDEIEIHEQPDEMKSSPTTHDPLLVLIQFCRTLTANQMHSQNRLLTNTVPERVLFHLTKVLVSYYKGGSFGEQVLGEGSGRDFGNYLRARLDEYATLQAHGRSIKSWALMCNTRIFEGFESTEVDQAGLTRLLRSVGFILGDRLLATSRAGHIYLAPKWVQTGDVICVLGGCALPMVFRKSQDYYRVVGSCYADGIMHGEAMREYLTHSSLREFDLI